MKIFAFRKLWFTSLAYLVIFIGVLAVPTLISTLFELFGYDIRAQTNSSGFGLELFWFMVGVALFFTALWFVAAVLAWTIMGKLVDREQRRSFERWVLWWFSALAGCSLVYRAWPKSHTDGSMSYENLAFIGISYVFIGVLLLGATRLAQRFSDKRSLLR